MRESVDCISEEKKSMGMLQFGLIQEQNIGIRIKHISETKT